MTMKQHAIELAGAGFSVFPLAACDKIPMIPKSRGGNGCLDATLERKQIETWWYQWPNANIGLATAGLLVVDLDGAEGIESWSSLEIEHGSLPTLAVATGSGGIHLYYRSSVGKNRAKKLGAGIDTRGDGGYVVAPPSVHPNGTPYAWLNELEAVAAPPWLEQAMQKPDPPSAMVPIGGSVRELANAYATTAWASILLRVQTSATGTRNDQLNAGAYSAGRLIASNLLDRSEAESALLGAAVTCGLGEHESIQTIRSGITAGMDIPVDLKHERAERTVREAASIKPPRFTTPRFYPPRAV